MTAVCEVAPPVFRDSPQWSTLKPLQGYPAAGAPGTPRWLKKEQLFQCLLKQLWTWFIIIHICICFLMIHMYQWFLIGANWIQNLNVCSNQQLWNKSNVLLKIQWYPAKMGQTSDSVAAAVLGAAVVASFGWHGEAQGQGALVTGGNWATCGEITWQSAGFRAPKRSTRAKS